jgi:hypothetical protein
MVRRGQKRQTPGRVGVRPVDDLKPKAFNRPRHCCFWLAETAVVGYFE